MSNPSLKIAYSALFIGLAMIVPVLFHSLGAGSILLPMFLPILLVGFFIEFPFALLVGFLAPWISALIMGMPPFFPTALLMSVEGLVMTGIVSYSYQKHRMNSWWCVGLALVADRIIIVFMTFLIAPILNLPPKFYAAINLFYSLAGVILNFILVPLIINILWKFNLIKSK